MIGIPEFLVVLGVFALVTTFVWSIHRILRAAEITEGGPTKSRT